MSLRFDQAIKYTKQIKIPKYIQNSFDVQEYVCGKCNCFITQPVTISCCGRLVCHSCIMNEKRCTFCESERYFTAPSLHANRKILSARVVCPRVNCKESGSLNEVLQHLNQGCPFAFEVVQCDDCETNVIGQHLLHHQQNNCQGPIQKISCSYRDAVGCTFIGTKNQMVVHEKLYDVHLNGAIEQIKGLRWKLESETEIYKTTITNREDEFNQLRNRLNIKEEQFQHISNKVIELEILLKSIIGQSVCTSKKK